MTWRFAAIALTAAAAGLAGPLTAQPIVESD